MNRLLLWIALFPTIAGAEPALFLRGGAGFERTGDSIVRDADCGATQPPALFGCGLDARGDFGSAPFFEAGAGIELSPRSRVELSLSTRDLELDARANFTGVAPPQPVRASLRTTTLMLGGAIDLGPSRWPVHPFVTAGAGAARHDIGSVVYAFPSIAADAVTITRGGVHTAFAWTAGLGAAIPLSSRLALELTLRRSSLGELRTDPGAATIVRPTRTFTIDIAGTRADVKTTGIGAALRWRL